jgi:hypothetical protein
MKLVLSLTKLKAQDEKMLLKNGFFTCATELVPLVGKVTALFYTDSWYCLRLFTLTPKGSCSKSLGSFFYSNNFQKNI